MLRAIHAMPVPPVAPFFATANIVEIFERCGTIDKVIVVGLGVFSLVAWTVMFGKHSELKRLRVLNHSFEAALRDQRIQQRTDRTRFIAARDDDGDSGHSEVRRRSGRRNGHEAT